MKNKLFIISLLLTCIGSGYAQRIVCDSTCKMLNTPVGKIMLGKATIAEMSKKSGMDADIIISRINELITNHTNQ